MDRVLPLFGGLVQLAIVVLIIWAVARAMGSRDGRADASDQSASIGRLFMYGLLFATLVLTATGIVTALQELAERTPDPSGDDHSTLALGLALIIVAGPAYGFLLRHARCRLRATASERRSLGWVAYLNLSLLVSLIVTIITAQEMLEQMAGIDDFEIGSVVPVAVWGAVWAVHWFWLKAAHGLPGDLHLAAGSLVGLVTLTIGAGRLTYAAGDEIYTRLVDELNVGHHQAEIRRWVIAATIGSLVWGWYWLVNYVRAERTATWHVHVVLIGALGGLVAAVISGALIGYRTLVWFVGDPLDTLPGRHFEYLPAAVAVLVVGLLSWSYHRRVLLHDHAPVRTEPLRADNYLSAGAGLVATVIGATIALSALLEAVTPDPVRIDTGIANQLILAATLGLVGGPLWWVVWSRVCRHVVADAESELGSPARRIYLIVLFGVGGIAALISLITVLYIGIEDLLDGVFGGETVRSFRVALSLVITVTGVAWYHFGVFRSETGVFATGGAAQPPPPKQHVVLISPRGTDLAEELALATGADLEDWRRTDELSVPLIDIDALATRIVATGAAEVVVILGADEPVVVPFET